MAAAWVTIVMNGNRYMPGAAVMAKSLRNVGTKHDIVLMVTDDVTDKQYWHLFDKVVNVEYVSRTTKRMQSAKQNNLYASWIYKFYTKFVCMSFTEYDKVMYIDADMLILKNCDYLFDLQAPAGCFSNPWAFGNPSIPDFYDSPKHGDSIKHSTIMKSILSDSYVQCGSLILFKTDPKLWKSYQKFINGEYAELEKKINFKLCAADEISIASFLKCDWHHIGANHIAIPWKTEWVKPEDVAIYHYFGGTKPWEFNPKQWPDLAIWWRVADEINYHYVVNMLNVELIISPTPEQYIAPNIVMKAKKMSLAEFIPSKKSSEIKDWFIDLNAATPDQIKSIVDIVQNMLHAVPTRTVFICNARITWASHVIATPVQSNITAVARRESEPSQ